MLSSTRRLSPTFALMLACFVASNCAGLIGSFAEIAKLQAEIVKEFGEKGVYVNLNNNTSLIITFINSPLNTGSREVRAKRAEQTATFVRKRYPSIAQISEIWVGFLIQESKFIVVHYSRSVDFFGFDRNAQPLRGPTELGVRPSEGANRSPNTLPEDLEPSAVYSTFSKQTEVRITHLQLEGDLSFGFAVAPHFAIPGDATGIKRSPIPPQSVGFDFASFSEKSMFPGEPRITFLADGKVVFQTSEQFSTSKTPEGTFSEFLLLQVPYPVFRKMIAGKTLTLIVGDREFTFSDQQLKAMRKMTQYIAG